MESPRTKDDAHPAGLGPQASGLKPSHRGFNLVELMFSILILGIGLVAVASLFPVAGSIQKNTYEDALAFQVAQNVRSLIIGRGFGDLDLHDPENVNLTPDLANFLLGRVVPVPRRVLGAGSNLSLPEPVSEVVGDSWGDAGRVWTMADRAYPSIAFAGPQPRTHYWVPLMQRSPLQPTGVPEQWTIYAFILKSEQGLLYSGPVDRASSANPDDSPQVPAIRAVAVTPVPSDPHLVVLSGSSARELFEEGDWVLDNAGGIHRIVEVIDSSRLRVNNVVSPDASKLWYAERRGGSPTKMIIRVSNGVLKL